MGQSRARTKFNCAQRLYEYDISTHTATHASALAGGYSLANAIPNTCWAEALDWQSVDWPYGTSYLYGWVIPGINFETTLRGIRTSCPPPTRYTHIALLSSALCCFLFQTGSGYVDPLVSDRSLPSSIGKHSINTVGAPALSSRWRGGCHARAWRPATPSSPVPFTHRILF